MQREKASAFRMLAEGEYPRAVDEPRVEDDGLLPYATADTARLAVAMTTAATVRLVAHRSRLPVRSSNGCTRSMIARPGNSPRSRR